MDKSQSSDVFSHKSEEFHDDYVIVKKSYELLLSNIKTAGNEENKKLTNSHSQLVQLLEDCNSCIQQCFNIINSLLQELNLQTLTVCGFIEDAVYILQLLADFLKKQFESANFNCSTVRTFPVMTGNMILAVFKHCKNSECIYGSHLKSVEQQLKELFRSCHGLQVTYLMVLEKHYTFDLDNRDELETLIDTFDINLHICEVVQALDVKTMAEQWKGYTMMCEKYCKNLANSIVINKCIDLLVNTVKSNTTTALKADEEDKIALRSLKVSSFALKILFKISNLFTLTNDNYEGIAQLFLYILSSHAKGSNEKSPKFIYQVELHLVSHVDSYLKQLIIDEQFLNYIFSLEMGTLQGSDQFGYIVLMISIMKNYPNMSNRPHNEMKNEIMNFVFKALPHCHMWFNKRIKLKHELNKGSCYGLYEVLLVHSAAFTMTFNVDEYTVLEKHLYECMLKTDHYSAFFSSNLWVILSRNNPQLLLNTLANLLRIYQKLDKHKSFLYSPQELHLTYTIVKLFESTSYEDKILIYRQFNILDEANYNVWCALRIDNLPHNINVTAEKIIIEKFLQFFKEFYNCDIDSTEVYRAIQYMKLLSTCSYVTGDRSAVEDILTRGWLKACPIDNSYLENNLNMGSLWYFRYIEALTVLTDGYLQNIYNSASVAKIIHVMSKILQVGNIETKVLLAKLLFKLLQSDVENSIQNDVFVTLGSLFEDDKVLENIFSIFVSNENYNHTFLRILNKYGCEETYKRYLGYKNSLFNDVEWNSRLEMSKDFTFSHKCILYDQNRELKKSNSNFDMVDVDSLFMEAEQPASKKTKTSNCELDGLIQNLENYASLLLQFKNNIHSNDRARIRNVCNKLKDITS